MADPGLAVHKALLAALDAALSCSVYDGVPQGASYPYVTLDTIAAGQEDHLSGRMERRLVYLNVWSRVRGQREVLSIMGEIDAALHRNRLTLDTGRVAGAFVTRKSTTREPDNETFMGRVTIEMLIEH